MNNLIPTPSELRGFRSGRVLFFREIDSTNAWLKRHLDDAENNLLVLADTQSKGVGRKGRSWSSPPGCSLYFSLLLRSGVSPGLQSQYTQVCAISMAETVQAVLKIKLQVKWPNDLFFEGKKIAGILAESTTEKSGTRIILGMGMNINADPASLGVSDRLVTSLSSILGREVPRFEFLQAFLDRLQRDLQCFESEGFLPFLHKWEAMDNFVGAPARLEWQGEFLEGSVSRLFEDGSLEFVTREGRVLQAFSGDLEL